MDIVQLQKEKEELKVQEKRMHSQLREMEADKLAAMEQLRSQLDQCRITHDADKVMLTRQISEKDMSLGRVKEELGHLQKEMSARHQKA